MTTEWMIKGPEYTNCNCTYACPCQFSWPEPSHGFCEAFFAGIVEEGHFGDVDLAGVKYAMLVHWPGPIAEGNGKQQFIVDESASAAQRDAMISIMSGKETEPFATHFFVFNSTCSEVLEPVFAKMEVAIDIDKRLADISVEGIGTLLGRPIKDDVSGAEHRVRIDLPNGFEYRIAEVGQGECKSDGDIKLDLKNTYGQFCMLHMNGNGVID